MTISERFPYAEEGHWQAARLPYGDRGRLGLVIVLPRPEVTLRELVAQLDAQRWEDLLGALRPRDGTVSLPRFRIECETKLEARCARSV